MTRRDTSLTSRWLGSLACAGLLALGSVAQAQALTLRDGERTLTLQPSDLRALPQETVTVEDHGVPRTYMGAKLGAVLDKLGAPHGEALQGEALGYVILATASDGYKVALSLSEIDPALGDRHVIVADSEDGKPLDAAEGPYRLVVKDSRRMARSAKNLVSLELKR